MSVLKPNLSGKRLRELADAATAVFGRCGFERSQMSDVAKAMGVAVGTVYLYVTGKEALFDLAVRRESSEDDAWMDALAVPLPAPPPGATVAYLEEVFRKTQWPRLAAALLAPVADNPVAELDGVLREQYALMRRHRRGLLLLMRSTLEFPGLIQVFVHGLRDRLVESLSRLIIARAATGQYRKPNDITATAATIIQTISWANLQRPQDPSLSGIDENILETSVVELLVRGLTPSSITLC